MEKYPDITPPQVSVIAMYPGANAALVEETVGSIIEAQYDVNGVEMTVRKSPTLSGLELSGDYNTYSKTWTVNFKGVNVECNGDGETLNLAYINGVENNYSISYNAGNEGQGLTVDQLQSIVMGLQ